MFSWTFLEVYLNSPLTFVQSITQTTGKLFVIWMYWMMTSQFICCIETPWTFTASCRWTCTLRFCLVVNFMWQMSHVNQVPSLCDCSRCVLSWLCHVTVSTWVRLCISVNTNMKLQLTVNLKQHPTVTTIIRSTVAVYTTFMCQQVAGLTETLLTHWTRVRFLSRVDSHVSV